MATITALIIAGMIKVCFLRSGGEVSMWIRYTSCGERGSRKGRRVAGALENGGRGPVCELGVDDPEDEAERDADALPFPERRAALVIVMWSEFAGG